MTPWLSQFFFNPSFVVPGLFLVGAPIIIHLINRLRFRRVQFAAMEFLLQSQQRNRRRVLIEQLLLLLLRILIVLALLALIARLILDPSRLALFRGAQAQHVVVLDDSGSMRDRWLREGGQTTGNESLATTAFQEGKRVIETLVSEGARRPNTQSFTLLALSKPQQPLFMQRDVNEDFLRELTTKLDNLQCTHRSLDLTAGVEAARELLAEEKGTIKHLHVISDFRSRDWEGHDALMNAVRALGGTDEDAGVNVNLVRTVPEHHENLALTELAGDLHVAAANVPLRLTVGVKNFGTQAARDVRLSVVADGEKLPKSLVFDKIEPGDEVTREFDVVFDAPGRHRLRVALPEDAFTDDNTRYLTVAISESNPVLIVDGNPVADAGAFVADALAADPRLTGYDPLIENVDYLRRHSLEQFQCIYLLNVAELPPDAVDPLRDYVDSGGGLAWFLGETVKPGFYNDALYDAEGNGLFPAPLAPARDELRRDDVTAPGPDLNFASHPVFRIFEGQDNPFVSAVRVDSYIPPAEDWERDDNERTDGVSTIATLRNKQPLMFEHRLGEGRIITCLTSAGPTWTNWPSNPSYVVFQLELEKYLARREGGQRDRVVGEPIRLALDPAEYTETVEISAPEPSGRRVTQLKASPDAGGQESGDRAQEADSPDDQTTGPRDDENDVKLRATYRGTGNPGIYMVKLLHQSRVPEESWYAYNVPTDEGDLGLADTGEVRRRLGSDVNVTVQEPGRVAWIEGDEAGREVRYGLLTLLLVLLLAEQAMAYKVSYHPKTASAA